MTEAILTLNEAMLKQLYEDCPEGGEITIVWNTDEWSGEVRPFKLEREYRLVPYEV